MVTGSVSCIFENFAIVDLKMTSSGLSKCYFNFSKFDYIS